MTRRSDDAAQATCPEALVLAAYVDRRLGDQARRDVEAHLADCAACRETVVESGELLEELRAVPHASRADATSPRAPRWWAQPGALLALAASLALATWAGWAWYARASVDVVGLRAQLIEAARERPFEARLSGFPHARVAPVFRSAAPQPLDPEVRVVVAMVEEAAARGRDADAHAVRAAALAVGRRHGEALAAIDEAIAQHPSHAAWHSDRAALLIALADQGDPSRLPAAVDAADRALSLSPGLPEALFNRALALDALADTATTADALVRARGDADAAWTRYLEADAASPWADEARARLTALRDGPPLR